MMWCCSEDTYRNTVSSLTHIMLWQTDRQTDRLTYRNTVRPTLTQYPHSRTSCCDRQTDRQTETLCFCLSVCLSQHDVMLFWGYIQKHSILTHAHHVVTDRQTDRQTVTEQHSLTDSLTRAFIYPLTKILKLNWLMFRKQIKV